MEGGYHYPACQACEKKPGEKRCSKCGCAYYCSAECQRSDWDSHRRNVCSLWQPPGGEVVHNPWYAEVSPKEPATRLFKSDEELFRAAKAGDEPAIAACIKRGAQLSADRGMQGETSLHFAVMSGSIGAVALLLRSGAYINAVDWRGANPLYYACTHPDVPEAKQLELVQYLVSQGADTMKLSTFSGKRPYEATSRINIRDAIVNSPLHQRFVVIRDQINKKHPTEDLALSVRKLVDLNWRAMTAAWLIQPNRDGTMQCFRPQPECVNKDVETTFKDCQARHVSWWRTIVI